MHKFLISLIAVSALSIESSENLNTLIVDVRTPQEYQASNIEGSINIEWQNISDVSNLVKTKKDKIILYCRSGNRSGKALKILKENGYTNVVNAGSINNASKSLNLKIK